MEENKEQLLDEHGVIPELRDMLDFVVTPVTEMALTFDAKVRLEVHHKSYSIKQLLEEFTDKFMDRSSTREDDLRAIATKIKMGRKGDIAGYIKNNRILLIYLIDSG